MKRLLKAEGRAFRVRQITTERIKWAFRKCARNYFFGGAPIAPKTDSLSSHAKKVLDNFVLSDLRRGTIEQRNVKRNLFLQAILENIAATKGVQKSILHLAKLYGIHRETMSKYYREVESMLKLNIEILPNVFDEKKRGRKENSFIIIPERVYQALLIAFETTRDKFGREFSSWTCAAIKASFKDGLRSTCFQFFFWSQIDFFNNFRVLVC